MKTIVIVLVCCIFRAAAIKNAVIEQENKYHPVIDDPWRIFKASTTSNLPIGKPNRRIREFQLFAGLKIGY